MPGGVRLLRYPACDRSAWDRSSFSVASCRFLQMACPWPGAAMFGDIQNTWTLSEWNLAVRASSPRCRQAGAGLRHERSRANRRGEVVQKLEYNFFIPSSARILFTISFVLS